MTVNEQLLLSPSPTTHNDTGKWRPIHENIRIRILSLARARALAALFVCLNFSLFLPLLGISLIKVFQV